MLGSPPVSGVEFVQLSYLQDLDNQEIGRQEKYRRFRDYYDGEHLNLLSQRMRRFLMLRSGQEFNLNFCPIVVDSLAERLKVAKIECGDAQDLLDQWWADGHLDAVQGVTHLASVRDGDGYVLVDWDNDHNMPRWTQENAYDGSRGCHIFYSDENRAIPLVGTKHWIITNGPGIRTRRLNLYYPDRIEKYSDEGGGGNWQHFSDAGDEGWPIPWVDDEGEPLGIPIIHYLNKDQGYSYGKSELEDVLPLQNVLNKTLDDLVAAADTAGFPMYTMIGGDPQGMTVAPGNWIYMMNTDGRIGRIEATNLSKMIEAVDSMAAYIGKVTRTPLSYFQMTGQIAAANTLQEQKSGLVSKAQDRQVSFGSSWAYAMQLGRRLANTFGQGLPTLDLTQAVIPVWHDDEKPDVADLATAVLQMSQAHAASTKTMVAALHPDWPAEDVDEEVALIQAEQGMSVPPPEGGLT